MATMNNDEIAREILEKIPDTISFLANNWRQAFRIASTEDGRRLIERFTYDFKVACKGRPVGVVVAGVLYVLSAELVRRASENSERSELKEKLKSFFDVCQKLDEQDSTNNQNRTISSGDDGLAKDSQGNSDLPPSPPPTQDS